MRLSTAVSMSLVLVLVASGLFVAVGAARAAHATSPATRGVGPLATDTIYTTNRYGFTTAQFYTGYSGGVVYFSAYDPSDTSATVTVTDLNATRDHVANPADTWTVSFATSTTNNSWVLGTGYLIPLDLQYGGWWNISISGTTAGVAWYHFYVHTYAPYMSTNTNSYLPGHSGTLYYWVTADANSGPYALAAVTVIANYYTTSATWVALQGSPFKFSPASQGNFSFSIPLGASTTGAVDFALYANVSGPANTSESATTFAQVGGLSIPSIALSTCASSCYSTSFVDGTPVYVTVYAYVSGVYTTVPGSGLNVQFQFSAGTTAVTPSGVPTNLTTNASGGAQLLFIASSTTFSTKQLNEVIATVTDPKNPSAGSVVNHIYFNLLTAPTASAVLSVTLDSLQYYGGDTVTATWQVGANTSGGNVWTADLWQAFTTSPFALLATGNIGSTAAKGSFSFSVPVSYGGMIEVAVLAYNASTSIASFATAQVTAPAILLNPSEAYYLPGDTVTVHVATQGSIFSSTTLYENVQASWGTRLSSGTLTGSEITFSIPNVLPSSGGSVTVSVAAESSTLGVVGSATTTLSAASGYQLQVGVASKSNYIDGSFQPGQTIQIAYALNTVGTASLPKSFQIFIYPGSAAYFGSGYGTMYAQSTSPSGQVGYTIPSGTPSGAQSFTVVVTSNICGLSCPTAVNVFSVNVEKDPSPFSYQLGAGSGVTVGWVVLLVIVLVVGLILFMVMRRGGGRMGGGKSEAMKPYSAGDNQPPKSATDSWKDAGGQGPPPPMPGSPGS